MRNAVPLLAALWFAAACVGPCLAAAGASAQEMSSLSDTVRDVALTSGPVTIALSPSADFARWLEAARNGQGAVALTLADIQGTSPQPVRINVFVDKPDATRTTVDDDPHFLGFVYLIPRQGRVGRTGQAFDLTPLGTLAAGRLTVTLVPIVGTGAAPTESSLRIGQIYIRRES